MLAVWARGTDGNLFAISRSTAVTSGSLLPWHGASSDCGWRNAL